MSSSSGIIAEAASVPIASTATGGAAPVDVIDVADVGGGRGLREIFSTEARLQNYLAVEAALALAEEEVGIIPAGVGRRIAAAARLEAVDRDRIAADQQLTGHLMMPIVTELARVVGDPDGGWVHWGATTQNIQQTGDVLAIREAHRVITAGLAELLGSLARLGEDTADVVMAGRTHWQQAVPITFGSKVAAWSDTLIRHLDRLEELKPRLLRSMTGGAAGTFATFGEHGPAVQAAVARRLGLTPMTLPNRAIVDHFTELVCVLGMIAATGAGLAEEIARLMSVEFGEVSEPIPAGDVGSTTMPQKRNSKLCSAAVATAAQIRALVPLALDGMIQSHEVDGSRSVMIDHALTESCTLTGDLLALLNRIVAGLDVFPDRMRTNLDLTGGLISAEAVMMELGALIGRQQAHHAVHAAARRVALSSGQVSFADALNDTAEVAAHLDPDQVTTLLDPTRHTGLSAQLARTTSRRAAAAAQRTPT
ncbi:MAG TPA: adenylosuccinate lyase family protein [Microlunatus sp.]|nr:adenylosuccinate lyase family protein [Microlunatus sp.]